MPATVPVPVLITSPAPRIPSRQQTGQINYVVAAIAFTLGACFGGAAVGLLFVQPEQTTASTPAPPTRIATVQAPAQPTKPTPTRERTPFEQSPPEGLTLPEKAEKPIPREFVVELDMFALSLGEVGKIPEAVILTVSRVANSATVHVIPSQWQPGAPSGVYSPRGFARAVQTGSTVQGQPVIIHGVNTRGLVDGSRLAAEGTFEVVGTESYITVERAKKTVFALRSIRE